MWVMAKEPLPAMSIEQAWELYRQIKTEYDLASLFAEVSNKYWWVEDNVYDFETDTEEYKAACKTADRWEELYDALREKIFYILKTEGIEIPTKGQIVILNPFMERNGFFDGSGWWVSEKQME